MFLFLSHPRSRFCAAALSAWALLALPAAAFAEANRVVALGGVVTEILYDLHLENRIVAVDTTSLFPPEALKEKPDVGYVRALSAEGVLSAKPDLVLAIEGAGPADALTLIRQTGVKLVTVPDEPSPEGITKKIETIGALFGVQPDAARLSGSVRDGFAALEARRAKLGKPVRVLFVLSLQNGRSMVGGRETAADGIIRLAGGVNAAADVSGYKPMTDEAIAAAAPDVILTMRNGGHGIPADTLFALPAYAGTPAAHAKALVAMDGLLLLGFGPRTPQAASELMHALYPGAATP